MARLVLPGFKETDLVARAIDGLEDLRESVALAGCDAQLFVFGYPPGQANADHTHEETRVTFVRSGRARFTLAGSSVQVEAGDLVLIPARVAHRFDAESGEPFRIAEMVVPAPCK